MLAAVVVVIPIGGAPIPPSSQGVPPNFSPHPEILRTVRILSVASASSQLHCLEWNSRRLPTQTPWGSRRC